MAEILVSTLAETLIDVLVDELNERGRFQLQFEVGLLEMELGLMLSVLHSIESLKAPSQKEKDWAEDAREVVRSVEDSIDTFRKRSGTLKRYCLCFNDFFIGFTLSSKIKRLMRHIDTLNNESKLLDIGKDGGGAEERYDRGEAEERRVTIMSFLVTSVEWVCAQMLKVRQPPYKIFLRRFATRFFLTRNFQVFFELQVKVVSHGIGRINDLLRIGNQILNVRKNGEGGDMPREENLILDTNTIISSFLKQVEFVLREKFLFVPSSIREVKQVEDDIKCLYDFLKDMEDLKELDEREKVWVEWAREIIIRANNFFTSFKSKREPQIKRWAKLKAPFFCRKDSELKTKMSEVRSSLQYANGRRWIFGMREYDEREGLRASRGFELESIWRDLRLIHAFIEDVEGVEDQSKRVGVWLKQMKGLARELKISVIAFNDIKKK